MSLASRTTRFYVRILILFFVRQSQGLPGEKGQKGDLGQPAIDVFQAVKVCHLNFILFDFFLLFSENSISIRLSKVELQQQVLTDFRFNFFVAFGLLMKWISFYFSSWVKNKEKTERKKYEIRYKRIRFRFDKYSWETNTVRKSRKDWLMRDKDSSSSFDSFSLFICLLWRCLQHPASVAISIFFNFV